MTAGKIYLYIRNTLFGNPVLKGFPDFSRFQRSASGTLAD
jgi:hypothetical protein